MQKSLFVKVIVILTLSLVMVLVISLVGGVVNERAQRQEETVADISSSYSGAQRTSSPFLVIPYTEEYDVKTLDDKGNVTKTDSIRLNHQLVYFPVEFSATGSAQTDWKHRGLFRALVYEWRSEDAGTFNLPVTLPFLHDKLDSRIYPGTPMLTVPISDPRGLVGRPVASLDGRALVFERGPQTNGAGSIQAPVPLAALGTGRPLAFAMQMNLRGTQSLGFVPYGDATHFALQSSWPSPGFGGAFLPSPQATHLSKEGFEANWEVSGLSSSAQTDMTNCVRGSACGGIPREEAIEVNFFEPINIYSLSNRAIKYGFLFVGLIFAAFFLFEMVKRLRIHPAQYLLVGLAIAIFFLLLISLSEHMEFWIAYAAAAVASTALITIYLMGVLEGVGRGLSFGAGLAVLYACLYGLLSSEDNALVLGSILLFVVLAGAMLITRRLDWYSLQEKVPTMEPTA